MMKKFAFAALALAVCSAATGIASAQDVPPGDRTFTDPDGFRAEETPGGYQPAGPLFSAPPKPDDKIVFVAQTLTPSEAFPAPKPLKRYPVCKKHQYNNCLQK